ncbi:HVA22-like protein i isoform X1 [Glycine soja]|uniref:HVA22-like protein n=1 Tax=Glycine soja TaxID=3848 RepID=A0A445H914_GLYSO|nr:HVA22-like protein i isoform X1 [Glycine soja]KHN39433.1 HVA22-like protein i [Glycine soja]RZB70210.1 HVA22-like protein i [Glycine soja]
MIGSFLTWALVMVFGYAYPAYECYKAVEKNKPEIEQLRFWCQYWILVAVLTVCERVGDTFISWVPMYSEAKLAFFIFLWYPKTKGTTYVYDSFFRPYVAKHETEIDRNLLELRTRAGDIAVSYWQRAFSYGQTRIYDILQFVAAQSTPAPRPAQQRPGVRVRQPAPAKPAAAAAAEPQVEEPPSPTSSTSSSLLQREVEEELGSSPQVPKAPPSSVASLSNQKTPVAGLSTQKSAGASLSTQKSTGVSLNIQKSTGASLSTQKSNVAPETTNHSAQAEAEPKQIEAAPSSSSSANENGNPSTSTKETLMEESIRVTRGRLRKTRSAGTR